MTVCSELVLQLMKLVYSNVLSSEATRLHY